MWSWIPACAGMTEWMRRHVRAGRRPRQGSRAGRPCRI